MDYFIWYRFKKENMPTYDEEAMYVVNMATPAHITLGWVLILPKGCEIWDIPDKIYLFD